MRLHRAVLAVLVSLLAAVPAVPAVPVRADPAPEPATESVTLLGSNVDGSTGDETFAQALARQDAEYAPAILRIYWPGLPTTNCGHVKMTTGRPTVQSFKATPAAVTAGTYDATLNAWLACFTVPSRVTYFHEPEDDFTTEPAKAGYRAALDHFVALVRAHPNTANLIPVSILADYTLTAASGRGDWRGWYVPAVDEVWWDTYNFAEENASGDDDQLIADHQALRPSLALTLAEGEGYGIAELGYDQPANRPAFLADLAGWARANHIAGVTYFDTFGGLGDHRLSDVASQVTWRDAVSGVVCG